MAQSMPEEDEFRELGTDEEECLDHIDHAAKIGSVVEGNKLGALRYSLYLEDPHNLGEAIGIDIWVSPDGTVEVQRIPPEAMLHSTFIKDDDYTPRSVGPIPNRYYLRVKQTAKRKRNRKN